MPIQARRASFERHNIYQDVQVDAEKSSVAVEEVVTARITEDRLITKSREALNSQVQDCLSNLSHHDYFGFENSGSTLGVINVLMTIGNFCGAPFLSVADKIGRRNVNLFD
ncbi:hypothetical protein F53441_14260 [Fusarium austroafricanum]|uniref:Major facilitator superfamily (MFS) profile domain-containing protein n=1 Tax=Fusarium austroafricanum TaxID=2364996 RepID=A0A8H4JFN3_9HYPO|nr:hypothetical protein F53441_14260 [Fusarium austroafricanum]